MEDPSSVPVVTAIPAVIGGDIQDGAKPPSVNRNGKKAESGSGSFFTWFIVLALLGVWTSVAVVYFDLVDYQGVVDKARSFHINLSEALQGRLVAYDADGDGDFDVDDAKVLLDEKPGGETKRGGKRDASTAKDVGFKLREALKQQLAIIHERVEAKKLAKLALMEVRELLAKEEEEKELQLGRVEIRARVKERIASRLKEEEEKMEKEEVEKLQREKSKQHAEEKMEESQKEKEKTSNKKKEEEEKKTGEGKKSDKEKRKGKADREGK